LWTLLKKIDHTLNAVRGLRHCEEKLNMTSLAQESNVKYTKTNYRKGKAEEKCLNDIGTTENKIKTKRRHNEKIKSDTFCKKVKLKRTKSKHKVRHIHLYKIFSYVLQGRNGAGQGGCNFPSAESLWGRRMTAGEPKSPNNVAFFLQ